MALKRNGSISTYPSLSSLPRIFSYCFSSYFLFSLQLISSLEFYSFTLIICLLLIVLVISPIFLKFYVSTLFSFLDSQIHSFSCRKIFINLHRYFSNIFPHYQLSFPLSLPIFTQMCFHVPLMPIFS